MTGELPRRRIGELVVVPEVLRAVCVGAALELLRIRGAQRIQVHHKGPVAAFSSGEPDAAPDRDIVDRCVCRPWLQHHAVKSKLIAQVRALPAEATKMLTLDALKSGLSNMPDLVQWLVKVLG